jgi:hypothetical protein
MAMQRQRKCTPLEGFQIAKESLLSGKGLKALTTLQELSKNKLTPKGAWIEIQLLKL